MKKGVMGQQNSYMAVNWGAFDHASHVPQLRSCNYYVPTNPHMCKTVHTLLEQLTKPHIMERTYVCHTKKI